MVKALLLRGLGCCSGLVRGTILLLFMQEGMAALPAATLIDLSGSATVTGVISSRLATPLSIGDTLSVGSCIQVSAASEAALMLSDRSQIRLDQNARFCLNIRGSAPEERSFQQGENSLTSGRLWLRNKRQGSKPAIKTVNAIIGIRGTEMNILVDPVNSTTEVTALEGGIEASNRLGDAVRIGRGEQLSILAQEKPVVVTLISPDETAQWLLTTPEIVGPADREGVDERGKEALLIARQAIDKLLENHLEEALQLAEEALRLAPNRATPHVAMATILQVKGEFTEALSHAREGQKLDSRSIPAQLRATELLLGLDRIVEAEEGVHLFQGEEDGRIQMQRGFILLLRSQPEEAIAYFTSAIEAEPSLAKAYLGLGLARYRDNSAEKPAMLDAFEKASLLEPLAAYPHNYLGKALYVEREHNEAQVEFSRAAQLDPYDPTPHLYLSLIHADNNRHGRAIDEMLQSIALNDNRMASRSRFLLDRDAAVSNLSLAQSFARLGLTEWAHALGAKAIRYDAANSAAYRFRANQATVLSQITPALLGDLMRAHLLQPVNSNTFASHEDYLSLLESPAHHLGAFFAGGNSDTLQTTLWSKGGDAHSSHMIELSHTHNDGFQEVDHEKARGGLVRYKQPLEGGAGSIFIEGLSMRGERGDLSSRSDPTQSINPNFEEQWALNHLTLGVHNKLEGAKNLLATLQHDANENLASNLFVQSGINIDTDENSTVERWRGEFLLLDRPLPNLNIEYGANLENSERGKAFVVETGFPFLDQQIDKTNSEKDFRLFGDLTLNLFGEHSLEAGVSWVSIDGCTQLAMGDGCWSRSQLIPRLGWNHELSESSTLHGVYFEQIQPSILSGGLQRNEIAGSPLILGQPRGLFINHTSLALERQWGHSWYTRAELLREKLESPQATINSTSAVAIEWEKEERSGVELSLEGLLSERWGLGAGVRYLTVEPSVAANERKDLESSLTLTYLSPDAWRGQLNLWFVNQNYRQNSSSLSDSRFLIPSLSFEKDISGKQGLLFFRLENPLSQEYRYQSLDPLDSLQKPWQKIRTLAGLRWTFD